jgi:hypothetical protein
MYEVGIVGSTDVISKYPYFYVGTKAKLDIAPNYLEGWSVSSGSRHDFYLFPMCLSEFFNIPLLTCIFWNHITSPFPLPSTNVWLLTSFIKYSWLWTFIDGVDWHPGGSLIVSLSKACASRLELLMVGVGLSRTLLPFGTTIKSLYWSQVTPLVLCPSVVTRARAGLTGLW